MRPGDRESVRHRTLAPRFRDALRGIGYAYREEPNLRFHVFAAACAAVLGHAVRLEGWEPAYLALTITLVLLAELANTAVERTVDLAAGGERHPLAARAKEAAAGAVLLTSVHAGFAAVLLFLVRRDFAQTLSDLVGLLQRSPWIALFPAGALAVAWFGGGSAAKDG